MNNRIQVLDHGYIELIGHMGGDLDVVNGARQSFDEVSILHNYRCPLVVEDGHPESLAMMEGDEPFPYASCLCNTIASPRARSIMLKKDAGLINFLMRERHTSPFELVAAKFAVQLPIFVAREWVRHRTQSMNEMSARYTQLPRLYYVPDEIREQKGKPGAYYYEPMSDRVMAARARQRIEAMCNVAFDEYEYLLSEGVAKEQARLVLPVGTYTKFVVSANLLNWMRFLSLRNAPQAQYEIRVYAEAIEKLLANIAPVSMEAFVKHGRLGQP